MKLADLIESPSEYAANQHLSDRHAGTHTESALKRAGIKFTKQRGQHRVRYVISKADMAKANSVTNGRARVNGPDLAVIDEPID